MCIRDRNYRGRLPKPPFSQGLADCRERFALGLAIQAIEGRHKISNALELAIDRRKADVGDVTHPCEVLQGQFTDVLTGDFSTAAALELQLQLVDHKFQAAGLEARLVAGTQQTVEELAAIERFPICLLYTSPSPRDATLSRMPSSA